VALGGIKAGTVTPPKTPAHARAARVICERALDATGWRWSLRLSRWLDALLVLEEAAP
jgi:hypothetical protein